ncbi:MAG: stage V sporulation protein AA [Lachnospiraceae bacterium]|nr:stage V sporulation protein AA [Lachnospiraceae bacterium]
MKSETVYLKIAQITEVYKPDVFLKDVAEIHCHDQALEAKIRSMKIMSFSEVDDKRCPVSVYVGDLMEILGSIERMGQGIQVNSVGESEFVIKYRPDAGGTLVFQWMKTLLIAIVSFCGAAFAIMTFNNDASVTDVFGNIYYLVMGTPSDGLTILEISYSIGLAFGILVFFNHFASWKLTVDPTPIEVEMRTYETNVNKTLIQNDKRRERGIDVS